MPDFIIPDTPFGEIPAWPPSPARLDRELDAQNNQIINVDWSADRINLSTDVQGLLPLSNIASSTGPYLLGATATGSPVRVTIGSNVTLSGDTLSAATSGGAGSGDFSTNTSTSVVSEIVLFSNTGGKQGKRSTGTGPCQLVSGVLVTTAIDVSSASNVTGLLRAGSFPALTGAVTTPGGSLATTIAPLAVTNAMLAGGITAANLVGSDIATVGTVTAGTWGATPVGIPYGGTGASTAAAARAALGIQTTTTNGDSDYSITSTDSTVVLSAVLTAVRTWTLPQASTVNNGASIRITDGASGVSGTNYIQITPFAGDTINGSANPFILSKSFGVIQVTKVSATNWVVLATTSIVRRLFTTNQTYTTPVGIKALYIESVGGGGGGSGASVASSNLSLGGGGGGGGYASTYISSPASSYLITLGTGGAGGVAGASGTVGGTTTFGAACAASGGQGGNGIVAGTTVAVQVSAGSGSGTVGDFQVNGGVGAPGIRLSGSVGIGGQGGSSFYSGSTSQVTTTNNGINGTTYGQGGGGALTTAAANNGGAGFQGAVLITEYY
jgi:hypothetical protein